MSDLFELASASTIGKEHRRLGRNNQDAFGIHQGEFATIAVVADGCSSSPHSEVGAQLGVYMFLGIAKSFFYTKNNHFIDMLESSEENNDLVLTTITKEMLDMFLLAAISNSNDNISSFVYDYGLFTLVGTIITPLNSLFFAYGDGVIIVNGEVYRPEFEGNAPPYLTYELLRDPDSFSFPEQDPFLWQIATAELESFVIGTDGVGDLIDHADTQLPNKDEPVGVIDQLWTNDRFFTNPDMLRRRLTILNGGVRARIDEGLLPDDTTLVVGRRKLPSVQTDNEE